MQIISDSDHLRNALNEERRKGLSLAFVPTMGNLHKGHLELVKRAKTLADVVIVSIFVNPLQFGSNEDLEKYPRTLSTDKALLFSEGIHTLFVPSEIDIYPNGREQETTIVVPEISKILCGKDRPGHFEGVATVVTKLLNLVTPDYAIFGEKDYQQLSIIRKLVHDLKIATNVVAVGTVRDNDGLALSSRNMYLNADERKLAPLLFDTLAHCRDAIASGFDNFLELESHARFELIESGFSLDYFTILDAQTLSEITEDTKEISILVAARLGETRLIDNVRIPVNTATDWGILAAQ